MEQNIEKEKEFFYNDEVYGYMDQNKFGIENLKNKLEILYVEMIK